MLTVCVCGLCKPHMIETFSAMNYIILLTFTILNDISNQNASTDGLLCFRGQCNWHVWQVAGTNPSTVKEPRMAQWHCPCLCGPLSMSPGGLPGHCHCLRSKTKVEATWHAQVTAGIGGHTCYHTASLLESWTPLEWQWWPQARWKMHQWKFAFEYSYFKSISTVGNMWLHYIPVHQN